MMFDCPLSRPGTRMVRPDRTGSPSYRAPTARPASPRVAAALDGVPNTGGRFRPSALILSLLLGVGLAACGDDTNDTGRAPDAGSDVGDVGDGGDDGGDVNADTDRDADNDTHGDADDADADADADIVEDADGGDGDDVDADGGDVEPDGDTGPDADVGPDPSPVALRTGEVRGLRAWPEGDAMHLAWRPVQGATAYVVCWSSDAAGSDRVCSTVGVPRYQTRTWAAGERRWVEVSIADGPSPRAIVETLEVIVPDDRRPLSVFVTMAPEDLDTLYARDVRSDDPLPADAHLIGPDGPALDVQGLRFRGSSSREYPRKGFNIRLNDRPTLAELPDFNFRDDVRGAGNRVLLNASWTDPTGIRARLAFSMYETIGLVAPRTELADLWLQGIYEGLYTSIERIDREAMRRWRLNRREGGFSLFRDQAKANRALPEIGNRSMFAMNPDTLGEDDEAIIALLQRVFDYRGEIEDHNWEGLLDLLRWVQRTPAGTSWETGLRQRVDVDAFLDFLALHALQDDRDSLDIDYWLYRDEDAADGRWLLIPWDKNLVFGNHWFGDVRGAHDFFEYDRVFLETMGNRLVSRTLATPSLRNALNARIRMLLTDVFTDAWLDDALATLRAEAERSLVHPPTPAFARHPGQHYGDPTYFTWHLETLRTFWTLRRQWLLHDRTGTGPAFTWSGDVALTAGQTFFVQDSTGWVMAELRAAEDESFHLSMRIEEEATAEGVKRRWVLTSDREEPTPVELTLHYRNRPGLLWLPVTEVGERDWELTVVEGMDEALTWYPSAAQPFVNRVRASVPLAGEQTFRLLYRDAR